MGLDILGMIHRGLFRGLRQCIQHSCRRPSSCPVGIGFEIPTGNHRATHLLVVGYTLLFEDNYWIKIHASHFFHQCTYTRLTLRTSCLVVKCSRCKPFSETLSLISSRIFSTVIPCRSFAAMDTLSSLVPRPSSFRKVICVRGHYYQRLATRPCISQRV